MKLPLRSTVLKNAIRLGVLPADSLLLYDSDCYDWKSGFGNFASVVYALVRSARPAIVVEVGSAYGKSTCFIAAALQRNGSGTLFSIDPHTATTWNDGIAADDTFEVVRRRLAELRLSGFVRQIKAISQDAIRSWDQPIDLLLLDGSHTYEDVKDDVFGFLPHIRPGGLVVFHDTMWEYRRDSKFYCADQGVPRVVQELQNQCYPMVTLTEGWGLTILQNCPGGFPLISGIDGARQGQP